MKTSLDATTRRTMLAAGTAIAGAGALAACGGPPGGTTPGAAQPSSGPVTIQYLGRGSAGEEEIYRDLIRQFGERNPKITVDINWAGTGGSALIAEKLTALLAANTPPDTFWVHCYSTLDWVAQKALVDLTPYTKEKGFDLAGYYKGPLDDFRWEGQLLSLPRETSSLVMFFNKGQFGEAGVREPTADSTWNDWLEASRKLTREGGGGKIFGTFAAASGFNVFQMIWQNGGEIMNEKRTQSLFDSPQAIETVQFLTDLRVKHQVAPQPADYQGQTLPQFFLAGRMSSYTTGQNLALDLQKNNPFAWDAVAVPRNRQKAYAPRGLVIPALIKVTESDVFSGAGMPTNYGKTWRDALKEARSFGITRRWNDVLATLDKELAPALEGSKPVPDAMRSLKQQVDQILAMP